MKNIQVVHFQRKPRKMGNHSLESYYQLIREKIGNGIAVKPQVSKYESSGLFKRLFNVIEAALHQGEINHVTGDVHFLTFLMRKRKTILTVHPR